MSNNKYIEMACEILLEISGLSKVNKHHKRPHEKPNALGVALCIVIAEILIIAAITWYIS